MTAELIRDGEVRDLLARSRVVAVLGAQRDRGLPAHYVPEYLRAQGYRILPVNPGHVGQELWGEPVRATLAELTEPVDLVDVFRRPDAIDDHVPEILAMEPRPGAVWFQLGIRNDRAAAALVAGGIEVVQDRCTMADHRRFRQAGLLP
jgi:predicted CoA-binding protein